jgi:hypothetical protein
MAYKKKLVPKTTNNITKGIINFLNSEGHVAVRINTMGIWSEKLSRWIRSGSTKGVLDIACTLAPFGKHLVVDVKNDGDTLSKEQEAYMNNVIKAGGFAIAAKDLDEFLFQYTLLIKPYL